MAEGWLARDSGKHHIRPEHKLRLAGHLAAHLWRSGRNALPVGELNNWFHSWIDTDPALRSRYSRLHPEQLEEDLRTATFLASQNDDQASAFRFAHTSLMEFFLASHLLDALTRREQTAWALPVPSRETLDSLGQLLADAKAPPAIGSLQQWGRSYPPQASELPLAYALRARRAGWTTIDFRQLDLSGCRFDGAELRDGAFRHVRLDRASFADSRLARSSFLRCAIGGANFQRAEITAAIFRNSTLENSQWQDAHGYRPQWLNCVACRKDGWPGPEPTSIIPCLALAFVQGPRKNSPGWPVPHHDSNRSPLPRRDATGRQWLASPGWDGSVRLWDADLAGIAGAGHANWEPASDGVLTVSGDAWRYLAWLRPLANALPERLPLESFGPIPGLT
mgnify:FL=1